MSRKERIIKILQEQLNPCVLMVENESHNHLVPPDAQTHFKVILVSEYFSNRPLLERHRLVNQLLEAEFKSGLHALSLHLHTVKEWEKKGSASLNSPPCQHKLHKQ